MTAVLVSWALAALLGAGPAGAAGARRFAVVVGANGAAPGRQPLRFAHRDAESMAEVLERTGEFSPQDVKLLLDPEPQAVLDALDGELAQAARGGEGALVLFYYSGHADTEALFPGGRSLPLAQLRRRLDDPSAAVRIGIVDACRGGGWTSAKGVAADEPFEVQRPLVDSEGTVLLAASSGAESAHESEALAGSFFTHHLTAGLRGAADQDGDGRVTVGEAFAYASALTVRDTSLQAELPQHPSFQVKLRGRNDLPLARVATSDSLLELRQRSGPLQVIQLATGLVVLELPDGKRAVKVAVAPGRYLVRCKEADGIRAREVAVEERQSTVVSEETLELVGASELAAKGEQRAGPAPGQGSRGAVLLVAPMLRAQVFLYAGERWRLAVEGEIGPGIPRLFTGDLQGAWYGGGLRLERLTIEGANDALLLAPGVGLYHAGTTVQSLVDFAAHERDLLVLQAGLEALWLHRYSQHLGLELGLGMNYERVLSGLAPADVFGPVDRPHLTLLVGVRF